MFEEFTAIENAIYTNMEKWKEKENTKTQKFADLRVRMCRTHKLLENERKDADRDIEKLKGAYHPNVVLKKTQEIEEAHKMASKQIIDSLKGEIRAFGEEKKDQYYNMLTTPPNDLQLKLLQTLSMRNNLTQLELQEVLKFFFDNYHAMKTLESIATSNNIKIVLPPGLEAGELYKGINQIIDYLLNMADNINNTKDPRYNQFYFDKYPDPYTCADPIFKELLQRFDNVPQLQDVKTEKSGLDPVEQMRFDKAFKGIEKLEGQARITKIRDILAQEENKDFRELLKYTEYKDDLEIILLSEENSDKKEKTEKAEEGETAKK